MTSLPRTFLLSAIVGSFLGCSPSDGGTPAGGSGGAVASGGSSTAQGGSTASGGASSGGMPSASGGAPASGGATPGNGGTPASGGAPETGGSAGTSSGGGGGGGGGSPASGGATETGGSAGASGAEQGGSGGVDGSGGSGGSDGGSGGSGPMAPLGASGYPVPPGDGNVPRPSGTPDDITVLSWAGFKGAVSYTFDDANQSQVSNFDTLNGLGVRMTFYLQTNKSQISSNVWKQAVESGHELGNHTHSHPQNAPSAQDVDMATQIIENNFGVKVWTMAAPYGEAAYGAIAKERFLINRGVNTALIPPTGNTDPYNLPCYIPPGHDPQNPNSVAQDMASRIDMARSQGAWLTVLVHGFTGDSSAFQAILLETFVDNVNYAKSHGDLWLDSVVNVGAYWLGQRAFSQATVSNEGDKKTFSWTLPDHFPPGRYLRVTVDGGTLEQDGLVIPWDPNGYYEIALDAGSVTLSP